jgi:cellobiose PTS system EIIA component
MIEQVVFDIIVHAGNARTEAYAALKAAEGGDFDQAAKLLQRAEEEMAIAHKVQTGIIQQEAAGNNIEITLLVVHAQDHLMTAIAEKNLIEGMVGMQKTIRELSNKLEGAQ